MVLKANKKFNNILFLLVSLLVCFAFSASPARAVPRLLTFQARLADSAGNLLIGTVDITFSIYTKESGGSAIWEETHSVTIESGAHAGSFAVLLGSIEDLDIDFEEDTYYLGVEVASDGEMEPRQRVSAAAFAINSDLLDGKDSSEFTQIGPSDAQTDSSTLSTLHINKTGASGNLMELESSGTDVFVMDIDGNITTVGTVDGVDVSLIPSTYFPLAGGTVTGNVIFSGVPTGSGVGQGPIYINPASATAGYTLFGVAVNGSEMFRIDAEGDVTTSGDLVVSGGDLTIGSSTAFSDSSGTLTLSNIDVIDTTTEGTIEAAIDTLANLTSASSLATVGTITTGTWNADVISTTYGGTGLASYTAGDILYYSSGTSLSKLTVGTQDYILTSTGTAPQWASELTDAQISDTLTIGASGSVDDDALSSNVSLLGQTIETGEITDDTITTTDLSPTLTFGSSDLVDLSAATDQNKGLKLPQGTSTPTAPASGEGLIFWETDADTLYIYNTSSWQQIGLTEDQVEGYIFDADNTGTLASGTLALDALSYTGTLDVSYGGTGATTFTTNGVLYGQATSALGVTAAGTSGQMLVANASGVPTFVSMSGDVLITSAGLTTIQPNAVALTTDTSGDYVQAVTTGSGLTGGDGGSEGADLTLSLAPLTADWNQTGAFDIALSNAASELKILESTGDTFYGIFDVTDLSADKTYTFPDASGTVLTTGNLTDITTVGTLTSGTWNANVITTTYGGTGLDSYTAGDILYYSSGTILSKLTVGTQDYILTSTGTAPQWSSELTDAQISDTLTIGASGSVDDGALSSNVSLLEQTIETGEVTDETLTASDLSPTLTFAAGDFIDLSLAINQGKGLKLPQGTATPTAPASGEGLIFWNTDDDTLYVYTASSWQQVGLTEDQVEGYIFDADNTGTLASGTLALDALSYTGTLDVSYGGTGATTFTTNGVLYGQATSALGVTAAGTSGQMLVANASGVPTFVSMSGDVLITSAGLTTIQPDTVALTTDTSGDYVQAVTTGSGLTGGDGGSEGADLTLSLAPLTADWNQTGAFDIALSNAASELKILESTGATFYGIFDVTDLSADKTYTFPDTSGTVLTTGNLTDITTVGTLTSGTWNADVITTTYGGTGLASYTAGDILYYSSGTILSKLTVGTQDYILTSTGTAPQWSSELTDAQISDTLTIGASGSVDDGALSSNVSLLEQTIETGEITDDTITTTDLSPTLTFGSSDLVDLSAATDQNKGLKLPQGTSTPTAPASGEGLIFWETDADTLYIYNTSSWQQIGLTEDQVEGYIFDADNTGTLSSGTLALDSLSYSGTLDVTYGGTGATTFTTNGILYGNTTGALQVTSAGTSGQLLVANVSGVPTFVTMNSDVTISASGAATIQEDAVALGTDTTNDYVQGFTAGAGLTGDASGEGSTPTLAVGTGNGLTANTDDITLDVSTTGTTATTAANSGLETDSSGLKLLGGCSADQVLRWDAGNSQWECQDTLPGDADVGGDLVVSGDLTVEGKTTVTSLSDASDVFVYDTNGDIDGGAWRKNDKAQATSWYNESSGSYRSSKNEFPKIAYLAVTSDNTANDTLTIYDASDNTMWMIFNEGSTSAITGDNTTDLSSVYALDGQVMVGTDTQGVIVIDFFKDAIYRYDYNTGSGGRAKYQGDISERNSDSGYTSRIAWGQLSSTYITDVTAQRIRDKVFIVVSNLGGVDVINPAEQRVVRYGDTAN